MELRIFGIKQNAIYASLMAFPKNIWRYIYVVMIFGKMRAVINAKMAKFTDIKNIITTKGIRTQCYQA